MCILMPTVVKEKEEEEGKGERGGREGEREREGERGRGERGGERGRGERIKKVGEEGVALPNKKTKTKQRYESDDNHQQEVTHR